MLICVVCGKSVSSFERLLIIQHINTTEHKENKGKIKFTENFVTSESVTSNSKSIFNTNLCRTLIKADFRLIKKANFQNVFGKIHWTNNST